MAKKDEKSHKNAPLIGIDIGGTGIKGGIVDLKKGKLLGERFRVPTPQPATPEAVAEVVAQVVAELSARPEAPAADSPVGVTFPGIIQHGVVHSAANVDKSWLDTDIDAPADGPAGPARLRSSTTPTPPAWRRPATAPAPASTGTVLVITLGTGIGSAFIFDGKLVPNAELGHLEIDGFDAETKASAVARERDGLCWDEYSVLLQRYFSHVEFLFSPELFIVGGGISKRADEYLPNLRLRTPIVPAELRNEAGIVGAAVEIAVKHKLDQVAPRRRQEAPDPPVTRAGGGRVAAVVRATEPVAAAASPPLPPPELYRGLFSGSCGVARLQWHLARLMAEQGDGGLEVLQRFEGLVDAGEAQVGHLVQLLQGSKNDQAHLVGVDFRRAGGTDLLLDFLGQQREVILADRAALAGLAYAVDDLAAAERFAHTGTLDHREAGCFHGGEPAAALRALAATPDG